MEQARTGRSRLLLILLPFASGLFGSLAPGLRDVAVGPFPLMLLLSSLKVIGDAAMDDLVSDFEVVLVGSRGFDLVTFPFLG